MQTRSVTQSALFSTAFTRDMLIELAVGCQFYSAEAATKLADQQLSKPSKTMANLDCAKLRTVLDKKLHDAAEEDFGHYKTGEMDFDFNCLPDLDIGNAGRNTKRERKAADPSAPKVARSTLAGGYQVAKRPASPSVNGGDEGKWEIWQHVWNCVSFEEYFAAAPAKAVTTKTGRVVTASSCIHWALKSGWIKAND
jgi:hypothetical protein